MKKRFTKFITIAGFALLVGCVSPTKDLAQSKSHPANPQADQSPLQPPTPSLVAGAQGLVLSVSTNQMEMQHGQHQMPASKGAQQPAQLKHEHEHKQEEKK